MQIELTVLVAMIGCCVSVAAFLVGRTTAAKSSGKEDGEMKADVKYIKSSVEKQEKKLDKVVENYDDIRVEMEELKGRMSALEQKVELLHGGA